MFSPSSTGRGRGTERGGAPRRTSNLLLAVLAVPVLGGCLADPTERLTEEEEEQAIASQAHFFQNLNNFYNCPAAGTPHGDKLRDALDFLSAGIYDGGGSRFRRCMTDSFVGPLTAANGIWSQFNRGAATNIFCTSDVATSCAGGDWFIDSFGCGFIDDNGEYIAIANSTIESSSVSVPELAGVIAHELSHNYRNAHNGSTASRDYLASVPERARACIAHDNALPREQSRTKDMPGEVELGPTGGWGGTPSEAGCVTKFVNGLRVRSGQEIDGLQTRCEGSAELGTWHGGTGGTLAPSASTMCPAGKVLIGVRGRSGQRIDRLQLVCAPINDRSDQSNLTVLGGQGGTDFESFCPSGKAVKRLRLRAGSKIDQIQLVCDAPGERGGNAHVEGIVDGGQYDPIFKQRCSGDGALISLRGQAGQRLDRLYGVCRATTHSPFALTDIEHTLVPVLGGTGGSTFSSSCSSSELMVGVQVRAGNRIDAIGAVCAPATSWVTGSTAGQRSLALNGGTGGGLVLKRCDPGEFLVGFNLNAGNEITGLQIACRDLQL